MSENRESRGRIEVAPNVLTTIARRTALNVEGVQRLTPPPAEMGHLLRRIIRQEGVALDMSDGALIIDVYVLMDPHVNLRETSRAIQTAIVEAIDKMVGITVDAVNVHVEDVVYEQGETA